MMWYTEKKTRVRAFNCDDPDIPAWLGALLRTGQVDYYRFCVGPDQRETYELRVYNTESCPAFIVTPDDVLLQEEGTGHLSKCTLADFRERYAPSPYVMGVDLSTPGTRDESWISLALHSSNLGE